MIAFLKLRIFVCSSVLRDHREGSGKWAQHFKKKKSIFAKHGQETISSAS